MGDDVSTAEVRKVALDWAAAMIANDAGRIGAFMAEDWVMVSATGIATREQFLALVESGALTHSAMAEATEPRIRIYGDFAVYTARVTNTAHYRGDRFDADEWTTDVFAHRDGRWRCVTSHITAAAPG
ncbi:nuclear transport factor 2 family protein [Nocardia mexicana]|uniref:Ketosteroid isomerase-like protein n=1 Tax=Nocardia mexicana TaxID=279262 RepID=A0A370HEE3_9NOCA|nr:nuclear transport factor 2 family protein [Nocardia mexicana]RDI55382.1 ketosteroid isomerase-like protein [Nocardia mexicana]